MNTPSSLYIHIPFCAQKCAYCDFISFAADQNFRKKYMNALCKELEMVGSQHNRPSLKTIFVGGGTPSLLSVEEIEQLGHAIHGNFDLKEIIEFSIEANPGTLVDEALFKWREIGVNRVSMGVQSMNDQLLIKLGRIHTSKVVMDSFNKLRACGFDNINLDIMFGLPSQTYEDMMQTVDQVIKLGPEHFSAYSLKVEEGTPFDKMVEKELLVLPTEEEDRKMYHGLISKLKSVGYEQYEISNFSKRGKMCQHNLVYWRGESYFATGMAAHGYVNSVRVGNHSSWDKYSESIQAGKLPVESEETIDLSEAAFEFIMLGLRLNQGVDLNLYQERFTSDLLIEFADVIKEQIEQKTIIVRDGFMKLTEYGRDIANHVISEFIKD